MDSEYTYVKDAILSSFALVIYIYMYVYKYAYIYLCYTESRTPHTSFVLHIIELLIALKHLVDIVFHNIHHLIHLDLGFLKGRPGGYQDQGQCRVFLLLLSIDFTGQ